MSIERNEFTDYVEEVIDHYRQFAETVYSILHDDKAEDFQNDKDRLDMIHVYVDHLEDDLDKTYEEFSEVEDEFEELYKMTVKFKRVKYY